MWSQLFLPHALLAHRLVNTDSRVDGTMMAVTVGSLFVCFSPFSPFLVDDTVELLGVCRENKPTNDFMHHCLFGIGGKENQCVCMRL